MEKSSNEASGPHADLARLLPRDAFQQVLLILRSCLPAPRARDPRDLARRDWASVAAVAALLPRTAAEGRLAAQFVVADAWAMDCLHLAGESQRETETSHACRTDAIRMMREAKSALRALLRLQAARRKMAVGAAGAEPATPADTSATQKSAPSGSATGRDAAVPGMAAGKLHLISNSDTKSHGKRRETVPRLTVVPAEPAGSRMDGIQPTGSEAGWKGRKH